ncbi:MAG: hypothetical protein IKA46_00260 [Clostridia bacterium]|nr:hypothetical protein [Clostridia bacterium]
MRKFTAAVLAVLMVISLLTLIPASSAAPATYDGTTKNTAGLNQLFITEVAAQTQYYPAGQPTAQDQNAFNYVEIYNNGTADIDLTTISLLRATKMTQEPDDDANPYFTNTNAVGKKLWRVWKEEYKFVSKIDIKAGKIVADAAAKKTAAFVDSIAATPEIDGDECFDRLTNAGVDMTLSNGEVTVLWFIGPATISWMNKQIIKDASFDPRTVFLKYYHGADADVSKYNVVMVWAWSDFEVEGGSETDHLASDMFTLNTLPAFDLDNFEYILGVAKNTWDLEADQAYNPSTGACHADLYSMTVLGRSSPKYNFSYENEYRRPDTSATFVPSTSVPFLVNAYEALSAIGTPTVYSDYFAAGYVKSYRETGAVDWNGTITPGSMPDWQWAVIDPSNAKAPDTLKTNGVADEAKIKVATDALLRELKLLDDGSTSGRTEVERNYNFPTQEDIENQLQHIYSNACDATCNHCGLIRTPPAHVYSSECDDICDVCGDLKILADQSKHVYSNSCDSTCNICQSIRPTLPHVYDDEQDNACNICGNPKE